METPGLYMAVLGATPPGRLTEQHDIFFGVGTTLASLKSAMIASWPEAGGHIHIDSWRKVTTVDNYRISVTGKRPGHYEQEQLFFFNLGGYKPGDMEEYHYKMLCVGKDMGAAVKAAKKTAFYKHAGFKGAESHIDDKYAIDVDDVFLVKDVLTKEGIEYDIIAEWSDEPLPGDELHVGYLKLDKLPASL